MSSNYRYAGNVMTGACPNGHMTVWPFRECPVCGEQQQRVHFVTRIGSVPVNIDGYLSVDSEICHLRFRDGTRSYAYLYRHQIKKMVKVPDFINDPNLFIDNLFDWMILTR